MKTIFNAALLAVGLAIASTGVAASAMPSVGTNPNAVIEHHSTAHSIGPCGIHPCPPKPKPRQGR